MNISKRNSLNGKTLNNTVSKLGLKELKIYEHSMLEIRNISRCTGKGMIALPYPLRNAPA